MNTIKDARYNLGIAYLNDGQYHEAIPEFKAVIELDPEYIDAHCGLSRAYLEQNDLAKAEESTLAALKVNSEHTLALSLIDSINKAYYDKGISDLQENQYRDAVISFQRIINQDSNFEHVHYNIGLAYIGLREYDNAIKSFTTALDSDSVSDDIHLQIGVAYIEVKQFDNAIRHLEQAKNTDPNLIEVQYNLARSYREIGNLEASTNAATETLRIDPEYAPIRDLVEKIKQTHYNRGVSFLNDERLSEAVASFQNAISLDAEFTAAHFNLGLVLLRMESYSRAIEALRNTVELDRNHKAAFHALSLAYFGQHEVGKARKAAQDAIDIDPDYQPARALLEAIDPNFTSLRTTSTLKTQENIQPESDTTEEQILKETKQSQENNDNSQKEDVKIDVE